MSTGIFLGWALIVLFVGSAAFVFFMRRRNRGEWIPPKPPPMPITSQYYREQREQFLRIRDSKPAPSPNPPRATYYAEVGFNTRRSAEHNGREVPAETLGRTVGDAAERGSC